MNDSPPPPLTLTAAPLPDAPLAQSLRLIAKGPSPVLLAAATKGAGQAIHTDIWALPLAGGGPSGAVASVPQLLPALPRWDAASPDGQRLTFVMELAGGALNALFQTDGSGGQRSSLTAHRPFASFSGPRYVRGAAPGSAVSAVIDMTTAVVLAGGQDHPIGDCIEVIVIAGAAGPVAVCKRAAPGASRGNTLPGTVQTIPLDPAYHPAGAGAAPFGDRRVFEVDADRAGAGLVVVATTGGQLLVAHSPSTGAAFQVLRVDAGGEDPQTFTAPCAVVTGGTLHIAVLSQAGTPRARALVTSWPLPAAP